LLYEDPHGRALSGQSCRQAFRFSEVTENVRLIILNQFFYPDHSATSQLMTDLAESLVERGVDVTALAGRGLYNGGERLAPCEVYRGVRIERAWTTGFGKGSAVKRLCDYLSFYLGASWKLLRLPKHDVVMALTTPPLIGLVALIIGRLRGMRVVALVQDVYPDIAVSLGSLGRRSPATLLLNYLSRLALRKSDRIVVLGECMQERVIEKIGERFSSRVDVIHNWADGLAIKPLDGEENPFSTEQNLNGKFVVIFSGNLGRVNEFSTALEAALILRESTDILFLFVGEGARRAEIENYIETHNLDNVRMLPYQPRAALRYSLAAGDVSLVTLSSGLAGLCVPSKSYGILAAGRPILFVGDSKSCIARIITDNKCGAVVSSGDSHLLAEVISDWSSDKAALSKLNLAARKTFEQHFDRRQAVNAYLETFSKCLEIPHSPEKPVGSKLEETSL
jgi:glycosyltransferase involved in cell wall biosynthesis